MSVIVVRDSEIVAVWLGPGHEGVGRLRLTVALRNGERIVIHHDDPDEAQRDLSALVRAMGAAVSVGVDP